MTTPHDELKRAAQAATQGEWEAEGTVVWVPEVEYRIEPDCCGQFNRDGSCCGNAIPRQTEELVQREIASADGADAQFIAAANPQTVLALLAELQALREENEQAAKLLQSFADQAKEWSDMEEGKNRKVVAVDLIPSLEGDLSEYEHDEWPETFRACWSWVAKRRAASIKQEQEGTETCD